MDHGNRNGQCIAVVSGKGGTGKTSFTAGVGSALAMMGKRTLCIDCDVGLRNLDLTLGLADMALMDFSDVAQGRCDLASAVVEHPRIKNLDLLIDILATTYFLVFQRLSEDDLKATRQDIGLQPNSICSILHQFIEDCEEELHFESPERLLKSLQKEIRNRLTAGDEE